MDTMRLLCIALLLISLAAGAPCQQPDAPAPESTSESLPLIDKSGFVVICPIEEMVDDGMLVIVERAIEEAQGAAALIFHVDTPGGRVDSAIEISNAILKAPCPTIAFLEGMGAISAGALISYSCDHIVMAPATNIGASAPILATGQEMQDTVDEKTKSFLRSRYRALGEEKGHSPILGEAMVDDKIEVMAYKNAAGNYVFFRSDRKGDEEEQVRKEDGEIVKLVEQAFGEDAGQAAREAIESVVSPSITKKEPFDAAPQAVEEAYDEALAKEEAVIVCAKGELLTLTSLEALDYGLIPVTVDTIRQALSYFGYGELRQERIIPTWAELLYRWLTSPTIAGLLLMIGIGGIYLEIKTPGFGVPGIIGAACLAVFFGSFLVLGIADWLDVILVLIGFTLIVLEIFVIPGFGLAGVSGIALLIVGLYLSMVRVPIPQYSWDFDRLNDALYTLLVAGASFAVLAVLSWKLLPKTPLPGWIVLNTRESAEAGYSVQGKAEEESAIGLKGVAVSMLRPAGRGRFEGKAYDVMTRGEFLEKGSPIRIIEVEGNRYVVAAAIRED